MRLFNWRRQAILKAMPGLKPDHIRTPWAGVLAAISSSAGGNDRRDCLVLLLIVVAILAPWITPFDAETTSITIGLKRWPVNDALVWWLSRRDIFSPRAGRCTISLAAGVFAVLIGAAIGTVLGLLAGFYEGW